MMILVIQISMILLLSSTGSISIKVDDEVSIKCGECPCLNPSCSPSFSTPSQPLFSLPLPPSAPPSKQYYDCSPPPPPPMFGSATAHPPPPPRFVYFSGGSNGNLYPTTEDQPLDFHIYSMADHNYAVIRVFSLAAAAAACTVGAQLL